MRFCYVLPHFDETKNSFSKLLAPIVDGLAREGHSITILSTNAAYRGPYQAMHQALKVPNLKLPFLNYALTVIVSTLWLLRKRRSFDCIHNLGVGTTLVQDVMTAHACHRAWVACKWRFGEYATLFLNPMHALILLVEGLNYRRNIPIIAVSPSVEREIALYYPQTEGRITRIENGVDIGGPKGPLPARRPEFTISFASNDHRKKGLGELLGALSLALKQGLHWRLVVLGQDAKNQEGWKNQAKVMGLGEHVDFRGHVTDIKAHFAASDVFCLPSYYEAFGLVFLEAAHVSRPLVGTDVGIYSELIGSDFTGLPIAIPPSSVALFEALRRLYESPEAAQALAARCHDRSLEFTADRMVAAHLDFYRHLNLAAARGI